MASLDLGEESEPNVLNGSDVDKIFKYVVRWLRNQETTRYFDDHPAARDTIVSVVQEVTRPKPLPTPAPTPCNSNAPGEQASTLPSPQHIAQKEPSRDEQVPPPLLSQHVAREGEFDYNDPTDQHESVSEGHHDESSPAAQQELEQGGGPSKHTYVEVDDCGSEESSGSQHSSSPDGRPPADHGEDLHDQDTRPNSQSLEQAATSLIQYDSETSEYSSPKRKHPLERGRDSKRPHVEAADATEVDLGSKSLEYSRALEPRLGTDQDERHGQQSEISEAGRDGRPSPGTPDVGLSDGGDKFSKLSAPLRAKLGRIADAVTLATVWDYLRYQRTPRSSADDSDDAPEGGTSLDIISASDQRLRKLKNRIISDEEDEKSIRQWRIAVRISKRVSLAELIGKYIEERDARRVVPKKRRKKQLPRSSPKDRFIDLLFPETFKYNGKRLSKMAQGMQVIKKKGPREDAKKKFDYWIQLGEPLAVMAQRYGIALLALLPETLTDKNLHGLLRPQIPVFLDYIDFIRPDLKEQVRNLSAVLLQILDHQLPPPRLVLETLTPNLLPQLRNRPLEELLQFDTDIVGSHQADTVVSPLSDQGRANQHLLNVQGAMKSVQSIRPDCTPQSHQRQSPRAEIEDRNLFNSTADYSEFAHPSSCHEKFDYYQELNQECNRYMEEEPSSFQDDGQSAQLQPGHSGEFPSPQDYYSQDDDWRAQPSTWEGEFLDPQDGDLQRSGPSDTDCSDLDSFINYSPQNTPSVASISPSQSRGQNLPAHLVDMPRASTPLQFPSASTHYSTLATEPDIKPEALANTGQNEGMTNCMMAWTAHDQGARTINPQDLFHTSV